MTAVYSREIDGQILELGASGWTYDYTFVLYDKKSDTIWYPIGDELVCIGGEFEGKKLAQIYKITQHSWKDWESENPSTKFLLDSIVP